MKPARNLLRAGIHRDAEWSSSLPGRIAAWLSTDVRTLVPLRLELERCRLTHRHEMSRLQTLLDRGLKPTPATADCGPRAGEGREPV